MADFGREDVRTPLGALQYLCCSLSDMLFLAMETSSLALAREVSRVYDEVSENDIISDNVVKGKEKPPRQVCEHGVEWKPPKRIVPCGTPYTAICVEMWVGSLLAGTYSQRLEDEVLSDYDERIDEMMDDALTPYLEQEVNVEGYDVTKLGVLGDALGGHGTLEQVREVFRRIREIR